MTRSAGEWPTLLVALLLTSCALHAPQEAPRAPQAFQLTVLHTNDHHGRFWRSQEGEAGLAARKTLVDAVRAEMKATGGHVLLLDAGDVNTGIPESDLQGAEPDFRGMSLLGYDAMAVGNHEFDRSPSLQQRQRQEWSTFPWLSANVTANQRPVFQPYKIFTLGGVRVAVLGLTTEDTWLMGIRDRYPGIHVEPAIATAQAQVPPLRKQSDIVIALTHMGHYVNGQHGVSAPGDVELARAVSGLDLIVGGHTHSVLCMLSENLRNEAYAPAGPCAPDRQNGAWIVQAGDRGRFIGRADFELRSGRLELLQYRMLPVNLKGTAVQAEDTAVLSLLQPFQERASARLREPVGEVVGHFDGDRASVRARRTNMGELIARAMQQATGADVAILSSGGIRASLKAGPVSVRDLLTVLPFGNRLVVVTLQGNELAELAALISRMTAGSGAFAQYVGLRLALRGEQAHMAWVSGQVINPTRSYRVVMPSFVADGGDGYIDFRQHPGYRDTGLIDSNVLRDFIAAQGTLVANDYNPQP